MLLLYQSFTACNGVLLPSADCVKRGKQVETRASIRMRVRVKVFVMGALLVNRRIFGVALGQMHEALQRFDVRVGLECRSRKRFDLE